MLVGSVRAGDLLIEATEGHRAYWQSLQTIHARFEVVIDSRGSRGPIKHAVEWWQQGASRRWKERRESPGPSPTKTGLVFKPNVWIAETVSHVGKSTTLSNNRTEGEPDLACATLRASESGEAQFASLWSRANFLLADKPPITILDVLESPKYRKSVRRVEFEGRPCLHITTSFTNNNYQIWLSIEENYLPRRLVRYEGTFDPNKAHSEERVLEVQQTSGSNAVPFPKTVRNTIFGRLEGKLVPFDWHETRFTHVSVTTKLPEGTFAPPAIPRGMTVVDEMKQVTYKAGDNGQPANPKAVRPTSFPEFVEPPQPEPERDWTLPVLFSVLGLLALGGLLFWRWYRSAS
jgi:hypothetical protein